MSNGKLLEIRGLKTVFFTDKGSAAAVNGADMDIPEGKIVGLVGESGCGKSVLARSVMGLVRKPGRVVSGQILFGGKDLVCASEKELRRIRGSEISMVFQEPMTSLNPVLRVGNQAAEALQVHHPEMSKAEALQKVCEMFRAVGISEPERRCRSYPHELSGGLRQRVMIAMAMICRPRLLIADEPTTALDVTIEAQILRLMKSLCADYGTSILIISHNLGVVAQIADEVYVMYAGMIMEHASVYELYDHPAHPYTRGLLSSIPRIGGNPEYLHTIPGVVPNLLHLPAGCPFCGRCSLEEDECRREVPSLTDVGDAHMCRCLKAADITGKHFTDTSGQ